MEKVIICTVCPNGCEVTARYTDADNFELSGNKCKRGIDYCKNECFDPKRTFTCSVKINGADRRRLAVRSDKPLPKAMIIECADLVHSIEVNAPVSKGEVICQNVLGTGVNIISSMTVSEDK